MKPKLLLLTVCFLLFYIFTDFNWEIGNYLAGHPLYNYLKTSRGIVSLCSSVICFALDNILVYVSFFEFFYKRTSKTKAVMFYFVPVLPLMILIRYIVQEILIYHIWGYHNYSEPMRQPLRYFLDNIYFSIYYSAFGLVFFFIQFSVYYQHKQNELMLQNRNAELSFLRSQINPHFLFNSLNNVYTMVYQQSAKALPSISKLSELLRYMLYEKEEFVPVAKEIMYLQNFIDLQLMRYDYEPATHISIDMSTACDLKIAPLSLIPFVENAFKHGDLKEANNPLTVMLRFAKNELYFRVVNKKGNVHKDVAGGIGLENISKRLDLIYGTAHNLTIKETPDTFTVTLTVDLNPK